MRETVTPNRNAANPSAQAAGPPNDTTSLELLSLVTKSTSHEEVFGGLIDWLMKSGRCVGAGFFDSKDGSTVRVSHNFSGPVFEAAELQSTIDETAEAAICSAATQVCPAPRIRNLSIVGVPIVFAEDQVGAIVAALSEDPAEPADSAALQTVAAYATLWHSQQSVQATRRDLTLTAETLDLIWTIESSDNLRSAAMSVVNVLREHLQARNVAVGLVKRNGGRCRVAAISGFADFDARGNFTQQFEDAFDECIVRDRLTLSPAVDSENRDSLLMHDKLRRSADVARITSHTLRDADGGVVGVWMVMEDSPSDTGETSTLLRAAAARVGAALELVRRADSALLGNRKRRATWLRRCIQVAAASLFVAVVLMLPVPYRIHCDCSAEPEIRRFVVAPHEGLIERTFVEPGDVVSKGELLARMDGRDVRWELAGLVAEKEKAARDRDSSLLEGDAAAAQRASLDVRRIEAREKVLTRQRDQLKLASPIDGIVLDGHLDRVENAPVTIGQAIYEVAPLSPVTVEISVAHDEFPNVREGFEVLIRFDGIDREFVGTIDRIYPRSELRDNRNVFVAEVAIDDHENVLRPGMSGYARISGETKSLGWSLFHRPWEHLRKSLPF